VHRKGTSYLVLRTQGPMVPSLSGSGLNGGVVFFGQGHPLKLMHDYTDLFTINVTNLVAGDPTQIFFRSTHQDRYLLCINKMLCERALLKDLSPWEKLELRPALPGNHYCFYIYGPSSDAMSLGPSSSPLPICFDEAGGCLVQALPVPGCQPAVFTLQTASSALLLQEITDLIQECAKQRFQFSGLNNLLNLQRVACRGTAAGEHSVEFQKLTRKRDAEEEQLVFLQDHLAFLEEQLQFHTHNAGATDGIPESEENSSESCRSKSSIRSKRAMKPDYDHEFLRLV